MCSRFHCLPSALLEEDATFLALLKIEELGGTEEVEDGQ